MADTKKQVQDKLDRILKQSLEEIAIVVRDTWMGYIQTEFYDQYIPKRYVRTDQLLNSIREIVSTDIYPTSNGWGITVAMDESTAKWGYGKYSSEDPGMISPMDIWADAAEGKRGSAEQTDGRFFEAILNDLHNGKIKGEFEKILRGKGLKLTIR